MAYLVLVRHGESEWNVKGLWTGFTDVSLTEKGRDEARNAGKLLQDMHFDIAFTSELKRAHQTLDEILHIINQSSLPTIKNAALNEKNYGKFTGANKWEVKKELGDEEFLKLRRSWDYRIPEGESLKDVYERAVSYFEKEIKPYLLSGKNVLLAAHNNSLRALVKYIEHISDIDIPHLELATGEVYVYQIDSDGKMINKDIRKS